MDFIILAITALLGLYMAWNIGANDVANSMAPAVGSNAITLKRAIILASICEFAGAVLVGGHVTDTVRKGIVDPNFLASIPGMQQGDAATLFVIGMASALLAAALWLNISTWTGMPVSTTHSIVGAVAGFGIAAAGLDAVNWHKMGQIVASWFISPVAGGILGFIFFKLIVVTILGREKPTRAAIKITPYIVFFLVMVVTLATVYKGLKQLIKGLDWLTDTHTLLFALALGLVSAVVSQILIRRYLQGMDTLPLSEQLEKVEEVFSPLVVISSCTVAFAHGSNDVANAIGPLAAVFDILQSGTVQMKVAVPTWILMLGGVGLVLGLITFGHRVLETVGKKITEITPSRGVAAGVAATLTVLVCTRMKLPVSTTHTLVGAVIGIGLARGIGGIDRGVAKKIFTSWIITVPAAGVVSIMLFIGARAFLFDIIKPLIIANSG
jgi:PiT family inorganic phosphate transporter